MDVVLYHMAIDNPLVQRPGFAMHTADGKLLLGNWGRPRPDYENPAVRDYFAANLVRWVRDDGVDGFRCDVASGVPVAFWNQARAALDRVNPKAILLAEGEMPDHQLQAFDIDYNFSYLKTLQSILGVGDPASRIRRTGSASAPSGRMAPAWCTRPTTTTSSAPPSHMAKARRGPPRF